MTMYAVKQTGVSNWVKSLAYSTPLPPDENRLVTTGLGVDWAFKTTSKAEAEAIARLANVNFPRGSKWRVVRVGP